VEAILTILSFLVILTLGVTSLIWVLFMRKGGNTTGGQFINPLAGGSRRRDGAVTYDELNGRRYNIELEDPRGIHSARYQRRHPPKQRSKPTKSWMK
jgi:hypothetical protein